MNFIVIFCFGFFFSALTHTNKDKADIALDDAENNAHFAKKTQYGKWKLWPFIKWK